MSSVLGDKMMNLQLSTPVKYQVPAWNIKYPSSRKL